EDWDALGPGHVTARGPVKPRYKSERWWPITCIYGSSDYHCLDLDPAEGGVGGQVIRLADDDSRRWVRAPSFTAFLNVIVWALAEARGGYSPGDGVELPDDAMDRLLG